MNGPKWSTKVRGVAALVEFTSVSAKASGDALKLGAWAVPDSVMG